MVMASSVWRAQFAAVASILVTLVSPAAGLVVGTPAVETALALRGGADLSQSVLALSGSALSLSGIAALVDPRWIDEHTDEKPLGPLDRLRPKNRAAARRRAARAASRRVLSRLASGVLLVGWGCTKLAVARLSGPVLQQFYRLNVPAVLGLLALQVKRGKAGFLPMNVQAVLLSLYAAGALGITKIPKLGDKYPDRFLEYLPAGAKLHLV